MDGLIYYIREFNISQTIENCRSLNITYLLWNLIFLSIFTQTVCSIMTAGTCVKNIKNISRYSFNNCD